VSANKKALLIKSEELYYNEMEFSALSDLSVPGVSPRTGIGTFLQNKGGCQGFTGPFPQPFLISDVKNFRGAKVNTNTASTK